MSVGYCTLYGDMNGGLAVIADLPKMIVYRVSRWRNQRRPDIPETILTKAPSAELRPDQTDQDSLPPYELLDQILEFHVEQSQSAEEIIARGFDEATVRRVLRLVRMAEFKRKQAAPGPQSDFARLRHRLADADCAAGISLPGSRVRAALAEVRLNVIVVFAIVIGFVEGLRRQHEANRTGVEILLSGPDHRGMYNPCQGRFK